MIEIINDSLLYAIAKKVLTEDELDNVINMIISSNPTEENIKKAKFTKELIQSMPVGQCTRKSEPSSATNHQ